MIPAKVIILCVPLVVAGGWVVVESTRQIGQIESELAEQTDVGRLEGESFIRTLQGSHSAQQLLSFDRRRELAHALAIANRNRFLGLFGLAAAGLTFFGTIVLRRIAAEIAEDQRIVDR